MIIDKPFYLNLLDVDGGEGAAGGDAPASTPQVPDKNPASSSQSDEPPANTDGNQPVASDKSPVTADEPPVQAQDLSNYFDMKALPEGWRKQLAGENADALKMLERVPDMQTLVKNYVEAQNKIRSGELASGLPENPTEEQLNDWRVANGIPESPEGYEAQLDEGLVLGEEDERVLGEVYKIAHRHNIPAEAMSDITNAVLKARELEAEAMLQQDGIDTQQSSRLLKDAWGPDYQTNINLVRGLVAQMPEGLRDEFSQARLANGKALFNSPEAMVFFADLQRQINPSATVVPSSSNPVADINSEIASLEKRMREDFDGWFKDTAANARLEALYDARERMNNR